jgi:tetratricopeptide (TPR) repeat protein
VLYDQFHEAELARVDLDVYLPRLYRDACELIVVVLSPDYPQKRWCGLEWRWIRQLILGETRERIMLLQTGQPGDLSELGILRGDGYLDISQRPAEAVAEKILERMAQQGIALDSPSEAGGALGLLPRPADPASPQQATPSRLAHRAAAIGAVGLALLAGGVWMGGPLLARWHLDQGDQAFLAFAKLGDEGQIQRAGQAWQRAKDLDPQQPEAHARLGFLADILDNLPTAEAHWRQAARLTPENTPQGQGIRNGLANVLAQEPGQRQAALAMYDADRFYPRSALEAAMLRWETPEQMGQAQDAIAEPALDTSLAGEGASPTPWGFKENGALLLFETRAHQRCLLTTVRVTTAHLAGSPPAAPLLTGADCQGRAGQREGSALPSPGRRPGQSPRPRHRLLAGLPQGIPRESNPERIGLRACRHQ